MLGRVAHGTGDGTGLFGADHFHGRSSDAVLVARLARIHEAAVWREFPLGACAWRGHRTWSLVKIFNDLLPFWHGGGRVCEHPRTHHTGQAGMLARFRTFSCSRITKHDLEHFKR